MPDTEEPDVHQDEETKEEPPQEITGTGGVTIPSIGHLLRKL